MLTWTVEFYEDVSGKRPVETWMAQLSGAEYAALRAAIVHLLEVHGLELASTPWLTALGRGLYEELQEAHKRLRAWKTAQARTSKRKR
jgi:hypothetical protein